LSCFKSITTSQSNKIRRLGRHINRTRGSQQARSRHVLSGTYSFRTQQQGPGVALPHVFEDGVMILLIGCSTRYMMRNYLWNRLWPPYAELWPTRRLSK